MEKLEQVIKMVQDGKSREQIQDATGLSMWKTRQLITQARTIISSGANTKDVSVDALDQIKVDQQLAKLRSAKTKTESKYARLVEELNKKEESITEIIELSKNVHDTKPIRIKVDRGDTDSHSTAFIVASDWHLEEVVNPKTVEGVNDFNLAIAIDRVNRMWRNGLKLIEMTRSKSRIDTLVVPLLGDLMAGYIHEELLESNSLSPIQSALKIFELVSSGIDFLLENGGFSRIVVPCCIGNHGRTTQKPKVSTANINSYEWLIYNFLASRYMNNPKVIFRVADGYFSYLEVYNMTIRFHHGDGIRYNGGVGGVHIPLNKAIAQWNKFNHADLDVLGHWHCRMSGSDYVVNGSVVGYNAYSIRIKADFQPPCQSFFLIHPNKGKTVEAPIYVT